MSKGAEVFIKSTQNDPVKVILEGDMTAVTLIIPNNNLCEEDLELIKEMAYMHGFTGITWKDKE